MAFPAEAFILAGGASSRFGSDKARHLIDGKPMISHVAERLENLFERVKVISKLEGEFEDLGLETISDRYSERAPICGLLRALHTASGKWIFIAPCDTPYLSETLLHQLWAGHGDRGAVPKTADGLLHPLTAFYHTDSLADFEHAHDSGEYSLQKVVGSKPYAAVPVTDAAALKNLNRPPGA